MLDEVKNTANGKRYNSDSHLVYNSDTNELECWWRFVDDIDKSVIIYRRTSKNGVDWKEKEIIFKEIRSQKDYVSLAIIYEDNKYKIWYVNKNQFFYTESYDLKDWTNPVNLNIEYDESVESWHLDVIHTKNGYEMILVAYTDWEHRAFMDLYYTKSINNEDWDIAKKIMSPSTGTKRWDNSGLYRSSFIYENNNYYVFYSGQGLNNAKGIGLMTGEDIYNLRFVSY